MRREWRRRRDDGFTLIECVVAITILGVILVPLTQFMLLYFKDYASTRDRVSDSFDIQLVSSYFSKDVASLGKRDGTAPYAWQPSAWNTATGFPASYCGQGVGTTKLLMSWNVWTVTTSSGQTTGTSTVASVAYAQVGSTLRRISCASGTANPTTVTVVRGLGSVTVDCGAAGCAATNPPPSRISMTLTITSGATDDAAPSDPVVVTGQRRQT